MGSRSAIVIAPERVSGSREAAAEGADQLHVEGEGAGFELGDGEARADDALLRGEHVEVGGQPLLVAQLREAKRVFVGGQRAARFRRDARPSICWLVTASAVSRSAWMTWPS